MKYIVIADPFGDSPFGQFHHLFALAFNIFKFCNFRCSNQCIRKLLGDTPTALFSWQINFLLQGMAHWNLRQYYIHTTTRPMNWAINVPSFFYSFSCVVHFWSLVSILCSSIQIPRNQGFYISYLHKIRNWGHLEQFSIKNLFPKNTKNNKKTVVMTKISSIITKTY